MITNPKIFLLDEPTSGLDSSNALKIIRLLKREAERGVAVICALHQPSSEIFSMFDRIICMSDHGVCIYNGARSKTLSYLNTKFDLSIKKYTNPADVLLKIAHEHYALSKGLAPDRLKICADRALRKDFKQLESTCQYLINVDELRVDRHSSFLKECLVQSKRWAVGFTRVPIAIFGMFGLSTFMVSLVGTIYHDVGFLNEDLSLLENKPRFQEWLGLSFYLSMDLFAISVMSQVIQIPTRNALFRKEH